MWKTSQLIVLVLFFFSDLCAQLRSPDEFLPHKLGEQFTPHHLLVNYVEEVAANSPNVKIQYYGQTYEGRPQLLVFVSAPGNLARLEEIRNNNLRRAGLVSGDADPSLDLAIIWLGYSVHGNEAAGSESSMAVLFELADPNNSRTRPWLQNTLIIIDPSYNPDGYDRYTHWYRGISNNTPDPLPDTWEHAEPWPRGRVNHYLFDLNRDWAWQTQVESRNRLALFNQWLPHIHVDIHEQGYNNPYYFAPAAKPLHPYITEWQRQFQIEIGRNNARYFDQNGWLYFTRERFDLFYPSYGDTYPIYNGAIGMTYEQGGIGAGRSVITENGDVLTLADRIAHHKSTSLATIEMASNNVKRLVDNFADFFQRARTNPPGPYKTFIIKGSNPRGRLLRFLQLLDRNQISYGKAKRPQKMEAYDYASGKTAPIEIESNDLVISAFQPRGTLAQILLEPSAELEDSLTYDITAWSLPYAYGLETYASGERTEVEPGYVTDTPENNLGLVDRPYAYLAEWNSLTNVRFLAALLEDDVVVRFAKEPFALEGRNYAPGTLLVTRADNRSMGEAFFQTVRRIAGKNDQSITAVRTGLSDTGHDLGSSAFEVLHKPRVALLSREDTYPNGFGQVWHYFEEEIAYPVHILPAQALPRVDLHRFDVIIMPEGSYRIGNELADQLSDWIRSGGRLIAIASAIQSLEGVKGFGIADKTSNGNDNGNTADSYAGAERREISKNIPGAIFKVDVDNSHPLAFGLSDHYFSLKTNELSFAPLAEGWNVGTLGQELLISGFAGSAAREAMKETLVFGVENKGRGRIIYLVDNPLYRAFWDNGKFLFGNAVFLVGQ